jgi:hypothetical protein
MTSDAATAAGPAVDYLASMPVHCRNGTGTYVRCSAAAFPLLLCECAAVARPAAAAVRPGGNRE